MKRTFALRLLAFVVLLLHGGAFTAGSLLDASIAARANATGAHVEAAAGIDCAAHDEASCLLCRVGAASIFLPSRALSSVVLNPTAPFDAANSAPRAAVFAGALHSRAPPSA